MWTILKNSTAHKLDYWLSLVHPTQMEEASKRVDKLLWHMLEESVGSSIPLTDEALGYEHILELPITALSGSSFQSLITRLPVKQGGLGLRCQLALSPLAYLGAVDQALPSFSGTNSICRPLSYMMGEEQDIGRWQQLVNSDSRLGNEFRCAWNIVKEEVTQCCQFLSIEVPTIFDVEAEDFGSNVDGHVRSKMVEEKEKIMGSVVKMGLLNCNDQGAQPVIAWKNRDKLSNAFLLNLPGPHTSFTSLEWSEALCLLLCLPSPCCKTRVGEKVGGRRVDIFGANVLCANLPGGGWTRRHDKIKGEVNAMAIYCGIEAVCEPYSPFSSHLPQRPLHRLEGHQTRQALRPDFLFSQYPSQAGIVERRIADIKTVSFGNLYQTMVAHPRYNLQIMV